MSLKRIVLPASLVVAAALPLSAAAAMYKWTDEHGTTHYGDSVPPRYASRATERGKPAAQPARVEPAKPAVVVLSAEEQERQKAEAKRQLERQRQDTALLATYANEAEIEQARGRELKRNQDTFRMATAGLARSGTKEDQKKLDALIDQSRQETDGINARFDAQLARYRELTQQPPANTAAAQAQPK